MPSPLCVLSPAVTGSAPAGLPASPATYALFRSAHVPLRLPDSSRPSEHAFTMSATAVPNPNRISASNAVAEVAALPFDHDEIVRLAVEEVRAAHDPAAAGDGPGEGRRR